MIPVLFYGTPDIARTCLAALLADSRYTVKAVVTQPDRPTGRKQIRTPSPVKLLAEERGIALLQPERIKKNPAEFAAAVAAIGSFDIAVVVAFGQILPESTLALPRCGSLNLHASLLPRWRGAAPIQRAIMAGDQETGVDLMQMDAGLDTGAVLASKRIAIENDDTAGLMHDKLAAAGASIIVENLEAVVAGRLKPVPQTTEGVTYADKITDADGVIEWNRPARLVSCQIRGLSPRPGAYTFLDGKRIKLFDCSVVDAPVSAGPGTLISASSEGLTIACSPGSLLARTVQVEGKSRVSVNEFLKGNALAAGLQFKGV